MSEQNEHMNFDGKAFKLLYLTNIEPSVSVGNKVVWSPIGPGTITGITDAGYPRVDHVAVTCLISESGLVFGNLRDQIERDARKLNKVVKFSYLYNDIDNPEGTGQFPDVKFGVIPYVCDARDFYLEWKISYAEQEKSEQDIKDEKRFQYGVEIATPGIESILNNKDLSDEQKKDQLIRHCANWIQSYAQESDNSNFYKDIITQIGEMFGSAAKKSDDGSMQDSVLVLKVPELVRDAVKESIEYKRITRTTGSVTLTN